MSTESVSAESDPPRRTRQPRMHLDVRREQVLDATLRIVTHDGYAAATMEAVAREARLAKPRVYAAYPGRGPLLLALLKRERARALSALADAMPAFTDDASFDDVLVSAATNLLDAVTKAPDSWRLVVSPPADAPPEVRESVAAARSFALANLRALLEWGSGRRTGLAGLDRELVAQALLATGEHAVRLVLADPANYTPQRFGDLCRSLLALLGSP